MIDYTLDEARAILHVKPSRPLETTDFKALEEAVDPFITQKGGLAGLVIESSHFPGWESLNALFEHLRFVHEHHRKIQKVAIVTNSSLGDIAEKIGTHLVAAEVKHFGAGNLEKALQWVDAA